MFTRSLTPFDIYINTKMAIMNFAGTLCLFFFVLFQILGRLSPKVEKEDPILISYVKEKTKLKGNPKTKEELFDLAETTNKKVEVAEAIEEYYKTGKKHTEDLALLYSVLIASKVGLKKMPKSPTQLWEIAKKEGKLKEVAKEVDKFRPKKK